MTNMSKPDRTIPSRVSSDYIDHICSGADPLSTPPGSPFGPLFGLMAMAEELRAYRRASHTPLRSPHSYPFDPPRNHAEEVAATRYEMDREMLEHPTPRPVGIDDLTESIRELRHQVADEAATTNAMLAEIRDIIEGDRITENAPPPHRSLSGFWALFDRSDSGAGDATRGKS